MKVGIIGSGNIARVHVPLIAKQPDTKIVGIADKDIGRARALATELKANQFYQDAKLMIDEQKPDIVHLLTSPQYHAELSIMVMDNGCHVLVEKPMALTVADAEKMIEAAKRNKVQLCVNHNMIFEEVVQRAIKLSSTGVIGEVVSVEAYLSYNVRRNPAMVEEGAQYCHWSYRLNGGPLQDLMPHMASLIFEFVPEIKEVQSIGQNRGTLPEDWQDEVRVLVNSSGVIGYISISLNEKPDMILLTLKGKNGVVQANLFNGILTLQKKSDLPRAIARGLSGFQLALQNFKESSRNIYRFATGRVDKSTGIDQVISRFYESIRNGGETPISLDKSLHVVDLMNRVWPMPAAIDTKENNSFFHLSKKKQVVPTALVTGASGFIGVHLIEKLLSENTRVRALVRPNSIHAGRLKGFDIDIVEGDLTQQETLYEATKGIKTIYHAGAAMNNDWEDNHQSTLKGTEYLIKAALAHQVDRFVHLSSLAVYELASIKDGIIKEGSPYQKNPELMGAYAYSKIESEKLVFDAYRRHGLGVTVIRPGIVIGPLGRVFFPHLGYRYQDKLFLLIGGGHNILPLTYVENTVDGIYKASIEDKAIGQIYNLVDDGEVTVKDYIQQFTMVTGTKPRIISLPYIIPYLATTAYEIAASLGVLKKGITSRLQLKGKQARVRFDNTKAKNELGWSTQIPVLEGLARTFKWYLA